MELLKQIGDPFGGLLNIITIATFLILIFKYVLAIPKKTETLKDAELADKRKSAYAEMSSPEYKKWSQQELEKLYVFCEFANVYGKQYSATILRPNTTHSYPFNKLFKLASKEPPKLFIKKEQREYLNLLGSTVKRPKMKGFATSKINITADGLISSIDAITITYEQNLITAHILEWELYKFYKSNGPNNIRLSDLPLREKYHGTNAPHKAILNPTDAFPLISVQALVIYKDYKDPSNIEWKAVIAQRSMDVAIKPGLWQLQPAGGFEIYGTEDEDSLFLDRNFNVIRALLRELAEELYNVKEMEFCKDGRDFDSVYTEPHVSRILQLLHENKASLDFLGIVTDLTVLRHEASFLLLIDDPDFSKLEIIGSNESRKMESVSLSLLRSVFSEQEIHSSSAGLLQLAIENNRLKALGISSALEATSHLESNQ